MMLNNIQSCLMCPKRDRETPVRVSVEIKKRPNLIHVLLALLTHSTFLMVIRGFLFGLLYSNFVLHALYILTFSLFLYNIDFADMHRKESLAFFLSFFLSFHIQFTLSFLSFFLSFLTEKSQRMTITLLIFKV